MTDVTMAHPFSPSVASLRVASIPAGHPYVRHLAAVDEPDRVVRLPDPVPAVADPVPGQWWPPVMLDRAWIELHHDEFDLMHLHFGFESADPAILAGWCADLAGAGKPLVVTVHDLVNPQLTDQRRHVALLDVLIPRADRLITLTAGAAAAIRRRWGRRATVIPHPHIVPLDWTVPRVPTRPTGDFVVGLSVKDLRANVDPLPVLDALAQALPQLPGTTVLVDLHPELLSRDDRRAVALRAFLDDRKAADGWSVWTHPRLSDAELWNHLHSLDLSVLPYAFGTHSGWLEACVDVGSAVLVPDIGHYAEQHGHPTFPRAADGAVDPAGFAAVLRRIRRDPALATPPKPDRCAQRRRIADAHERIYRSAVATARVRSGR